MGTASSSPMKTPKAIREDTIVLFDIAPAVRIIVIQMKVLRTFPMRPSGTR